MQVSRSCRQLFRDFQRLGCGHAYSERGDQFCGATVAAREREKERERERIRRTLKKVKGAAQSTSAVVKLRGWQREHRSSVRQTPERFFEMYPPWPVNGGVSS